MIARTSWLSKTTNPPPKASDLDPRIVKPPAGVSMAVEEVHPRQAGAWLEARRANRRISPANVSFLAWQIVDGKWGLNGQALIFDTEGRLIDGQHRCAAVVEADKPIRTIVIRGIDPEQFATIDTGAARTNAHVLAIKGRKYYTNVASVLKLLANYRDGHFTGTRSRVTNTRILALDEANPGVEDSVYWCFGLHKKGFCVAVIAFAHYYCTQALSRSERFFDALLEEKPSIAAARELLRRVCEDREEDRHVTAYEQLARVVLAFNAWIDRRRVTAEDLVWSRRGQGSGRPLDFPRFRFRARRRA